MPANDGSPHSSLCRKFPCPESLDEDLFKMMFPDLPQGDPPPPTIPPAVAADAALYVAVIVIFYAAIIMILVGTNLHRFRNTPSNPDNIQAVPLTVYANPGRPGRGEPVLTTVAEDKNSEENELLLLSDIVPV